MGTRSETVGQLVRARQFDEAVQRYRDERAAALRFEKQLDRQITRLDRLRKRLATESADRQERLDELRREMDAINDASGFERYVGGLFGVDDGAGEVGDRDDPPWLRQSIRLGEALRREVFEQAVMLLIKAVPAEGDGQGQGDGSGGTDGDGDGDGDGGNG